MRVFNITERSHGRFFRTFPKPFRIVTFQNSRQLVKISPEIVMYCFPYVYIISFAHLFQHPLIKIYLMVLESKKIWFRIMLSWNKFDKICVIIFWKTFPFGFAWVNKISHKNYHNGNQALRNMGGIILWNCFLAPEN